MLIYINYFFPKNLWLPELLRSFKQVLVIPCARFNLVRTDEIQSFGMTNECDPQFEESQIYFIM